MHHIPKVDAIIVGLYLVLSFVVGVFVAKILRRGTKGEEGYFLAGRRMPGWLTGISTAVTAMNADVGLVYFIIPENSSDRTGLDAVSTTNAFRVVYSDSSAISLN